MTLFYVLLYYCGVEYNTTLNLFYKPDLWLVIYIYIQTMNFAAATA